MSKTLNQYHQRGDFAAHIHEEDFIHAAVELLSGTLFSRPLERYTHEILNPPYSKEGEHFSFEHGSIDNKRIQDRIVTVMEGGEDAFRRRKEIYQLTIRMEMRSWRRFI